jgi:hypothetical protein
MSTPNDDLAAKVGVDKPTNDARQIYDAERGEWVDVKFEKLDAPQLPVQPAPFGPLK